MKKHGYALAQALEEEANEIATESRAELVREAATEIIALIQENRKLLDRLETINNQNAGIS